jgi:hypothetical protein
MLSAVGLGCGGNDGDTDCERTPDTACRDSQGEGQSAGSDSAADDEANGEANDEAADDEAADDEAQGEAGESSGGRVDTGNDEGETGQSATSEGETTLGETGRPDDCAGLDQDTCFAQSQLGNCEPVWGVPWIEVDGGWCLFPNGTAYLGCAVQDDCMDVESTVCGAGTASSTWNVSTTCLPSDVSLTQCEPPGDCVY